MCTKEKIILISIYSNNLLSTLPTGGVGGLVLVFTTDSLDVLECRFLYLLVGVEGLGGALSPRIGVVALILGRVFEPDWKDIK